MNQPYLLLSRSSNQARGIGHYALDFLAGRLGMPSDPVFQRLEQFHLDSVACAIAALAEHAPAPALLRDEALSYPDEHGAVCFGSTRRVASEKAVLANCSAVRELDANGTNFGHNPRTGYSRGEFGHNDFYPVAIAAASVAGANGRQTLLGMLCLDEIRARLAEVFGLKDHKIDHVLHGAIASAAVYGAMLGATAEQIESAIGLVVAHYVPFRAIRHGEQLSDSKGASVAISAEVAVLSMRRAMRGFAGPADIFRNAQAVFCLFEPPQEPDASPFDLELTCGGDDFAVMGMHFKLGLYEHQSAGAIEGLIRLLTEHPQLLSDPANLKRITITTYEPAFSIIGDSHKRDPRTRQSADHSMVYIIATLLRKALERGRGSGNGGQGVADSWKDLMLTPADYSDAAIMDPLTRDLMRRIEFRHGGPEYDSKYPDGIPTTVEIHHATLGRASSGLVMYPTGHARGENESLERLLEHKFHLLTSRGVNRPDDLLRRLADLRDKSVAEIAELYSFEIANVRPA
jgi:2-methylcitrate dehydratase